MQQIELMAIDQPIIVYDKKEKGSGKSSDGKFGTPTASAFRKAMEKQKEIEARKAQKEQTKK